MFRQHFACSVFGDDFLPCKERTRQSKSTSLFKMKTMRVGPRPVDYHGVHTEVFRRITSLAFAVYILMHEAYPGMISRATRNTTKTQSERGTFFHSLLAFGLSGDLVPRFHCCYDTSTAVTFACSVLPVTPYGPPSCSLFPSRRARNGSVEATHSGIDDGISVSLQHHDRWLSDLHHVSNHRRKSPVCMM